MPATGLSLLPRERIHCLPGDGAPPHLARRRRTFDRGELYRRRKPLQDRQSFPLFQDDRRPDGYHQTAVDEVSPGKNVELTQRFDIVVGRPQVADLPLLEGHQFFELPVCWWSANGPTAQWINSPGYEDGAVRFDRPIYPRCLECHASYFTSLAPPPNKYEPNTSSTRHQMRRCHCPGREHVALYSSPNPPKAAPKGHRQPGLPPAQPPDRRLRPMPRRTRKHPPAGPVFPARDALDKYLAASPTPTPTSPSMSMATRSNC